MFSRLRPFLLQFRALFSDPSHVDHSLKKQTPFKMIARGASLLSVSVGLWAATLPLFSAGSAYAEGPQKRLYVLTPVVENSVEVSKPWRAAEWLFVSAEALAKAGMMYATTHEPIAAGNYLAFQTVKIVPKMMAMSAGVVEGLTSRQTRRETQQMAQVPNVDRIVTISGKEVRMSGPVTIAQNKKTLIMVESEGELPTDVSVRDLTRPDVTILDPSMKPIGDQADARLELKLTLPGKDTSRLPVWKPTLLELAGGAEMPAEIRDAWSREVEDFNKLNRSQKAIAQMRGKMRGKAPSIDAQLAIEGNEHAVGPLFKGAAVTDLLKRNWLMLSDENGLIPTDEKFKKLLKIANKPQVLGGQLELVRNPAEARLEFRLAIEGKDLADAPVWKPSLLELMEGVEMPREIRDAWSKEIDAHEKDHSVLQKYITHSREGEIKIMADLRIDGQERPLGSFVQGSGVKKFISHGWLRQTIDKVMHHPILRREPKKVSASTYNVIDEADKENSCGALYRRILRKDLIRMD